MSNVVVRLSSEILFGSHLKEMEQIGDICQLSLNNLIEFAIAFVEYEDMGGGFLNDDDLIRDCFGGHLVGWRAIEIIKHQRNEIMAYIPLDAVELRYLRTHGTGVFVYARTPDHVNAGQGNLLS